MTDLKTTVVIGAGPAGCMAAGTAAENGGRVILIDKNSKIGRKLMITGKGRCNVTNCVYTVNELLKNIPVNGRFLYGSFSRFMPVDTMDFFEDLGVPLKVERGERVFPISDKASDIVDGLYRFIRKNGVDFRNEIAKEIICDGEKVTGVRTDKGVIPAERVILAVGGASYPVTGSTGDGYEMAKKIGHTIIAPVPSLVPLESDCVDCADMQGLSLKNVGMYVVDEKTGKKVYEDFGEMLFTHFGMSGPLILSASSNLHPMEENRYTVHIDLKPALDEEKLDKRIQRDFLENTNKAFGNAISGLMPRKMIPVVIKRSAVDPDKRVNQITQDERKSLLNVLKDFTIPIKGFRPLKEAIVTSGGVSTKEINPKTMESKLVRGLFFAGEVIDVDAYTGGFNLQIAFSTGKLAGENV